MPNTGIKGYHYHQGYTSLLAFSRPSLKNGSIQIPYLSSRFAEVPKTSKKRPHFAQIIGISLLLQ
jgi:hypothetical protein